MVLDWSTLPSTFLTRTVGPLAHEVALAEGSLVEVAQYLQVPTQVLVAEAFLSTVYDAREGLHLSLVRRGYEGGIPAETLRPLRRIEAALPPGSISELTPYLMEPVVGGYRLEGSRVTSQSERASRRRDATYFTPPDVAAAMVRQVLQRAEDTGSVLDPCCGTGIFLREWVRARIDDVDSTTLLSSLRGIDLNARSLDVCAAVLAFELDTAAGGWRLARDRLQQGDSIEMLASGSLPQQSIVIGNPPYGRGTDGHDRAAGFLTLMRESLGLRGTGVMVVPSSVLSASTGEMAAARRSLLDSGSTTFLNYDRSPDSIFGDDIKQRATILIHRRAADRSLTTSSMLRWRRPERAAVLSERTTVNLVGWSFDRVPAIGSQLEATVIRKVLSLSSSSASSRERGPGTEAVWIAGTAYNWISAGLGAPPEGSSRRVVQLGDALAAEAFFAAISSRVAYWIWRAIGDGFHVSGAFVERVESLARHVVASRQPQLSDLGGELWTVAQAHPVVSLNRGVQTVSYVLPSGSKQMSDVDAILLEALGLSRRDQRVFIDTVLTAARQTHTGSERST